MSRYLVVAAGALLTVGCNTSGHSFALPTAPTPPPIGSAPAPPQVPVPAPPPAPVFPPNVEITSITIGEVVTRTIGESPSECIDFRGWPCQYFQVTPSRNGTLVIDVIYVPNTQPPGRTQFQVIDISLRGGTEGERWAQSGTESSGRLTARVTADTVYTITLWYTFPRLQYELRTAIGD